MSFPMFLREPSPDYASSTHSDEPQAQPKKSGGVRKVVGDPNYASTRRDSVIPDFDFGVTQSLTPLPSRPGTATGTRSPLEITSPPTPLTPNENIKKRIDRVSPRHVSPLPSPRSRPSSRQMWYPAVATGPQSPGGLSAEEFVQQRAAMARLPSGYVPRRSMSSNKIEMKTPSPEQIQKHQLQKRHTARQSSQGSMLDFSSTLSAREQEHVARMTGSPLLNIPDRSQAPDPNVGLIGAISAREQERRSMKEGVSSQMVHNAIAQRQQLAQIAYHQQMQARHQSGINAWNQYQNPYALSGHYPLQSYHEYQQQYYQQSLQQSPFVQNQIQPGNYVYQQYYAPRPQSGYRQQ